MDLSPGRRAARHRRGRGRGKSRALADHLIFVLGFGGALQANVKDPEADDVDEHGYPIFRSITERCNACEIYGGIQRPCQSAGVLEDIERRHGRPCPRVLLDPDPDLFVAAEVLGLVLSEELRPLAPAYLRACVPRRADRRAILDLVHGVLSDPRVVAARREAMTARDSTEAQR